MASNPVTILCVDDDAEILKSRELLFKQFGYEVITTTSGPTALGMLADGSDVDLVLLDYLMPEMNGDEVAHRLHEQHPRLPVILVSGAPQIPEELIAVVDAFVDKGQDPEILLSRISEVIEMYGRSA